MNPRVVVVTGAADGIGWATAQCLAQQGWRVALLDLRAEAAQARTAELGPGHLGLGCDVTDVAAVHTAVSAVAAQWGRIHVRVNNASRGQRGAIVNLASIAALGGIPARNAYSAAKAGVVGMTRAMAKECSAAASYITGKRFSRAVSQLAVAPQSTMSAMPASSSAPGM